MNIAEVRTEFKEAVILKDGRRVKALVETIGDGIDHKEFFVTGKNCHICASGKHFEPCGYMDTNSRGTDTAMRLAREQGIKAKTKTIEID